MLGRKEDAENDSCQRSGQQSQTLANGERTAALPQCIRLHDLHEFIPGCFVYPLLTDVDPRVCEEDVQPPVLLQRFVYNRFHLRFVPGVQLPNVNLDLRVQRCQLPLVHLEELRAIVADEDGFGAVVGVLVCARSPNAERGVGAGYDDHFAFYASGIVGG